MTRTSRTASDDSDSATDYLLLVPLDALPPQLTPNSDKALIAEAAIATFDIELSQHDDMHLPQLEAFRKGLV